MMIRKMSALLVALAITAGAVHAGPVAIRNTAPVAAPNELLFGSGFHIGGHALFLTPDADRGHDTWGGGVNVDYYFNPYFGLQTSGAWADPGTGETWHNYTLDLVLRAPVESAHFAPYVFVGGGAIVEDGAHVLGRAGVGIEFRPTSRFGIFADWVYNFPGGGGGSDDIEDYQMVRMGVKLGF